MEVDSGHAALIELIATFGDAELSQENEAGTRKKVIDAVLEDVLGWDMAGDLSYEERVSEDGNTKFADYVIRSATTSIIVEAKRAGKAFELPSHRRTAKLGGVLSEGEVGQAIRQVRDYCRKKSIPYAVVTNGSSWIIFPAVRTDGVTFEETQAYIFKGLEDILSRFVEFWELLSRQRVIEGNLESTFFSSAGRETERRLVSTLNEGGFRLGRNAVYEHIEPAIEAALTDEAIVNDPEGLEYCYVKNSERVKYDTRLRMHLGDVKPKLDRKAVRPRLRGELTPLDSALAFDGIRSPQFLLVLGSVGAGKTTFLQYTRLVSAKAQIEKKLVWFYIDFKKATESDNPRRFIFSELLGLVESDPDFDMGDWEKTISRAYGSLIENLKRGPMQPLFVADRSKFDVLISEKIMSDRELVEPYVTTLLSYISSKWPVYVVIDNVDQLEDEELQRRIFVEAQAAARKFGANVIMSMREATYLRHRSTPVFDAFQVDTIYVDAPDIRPVLSRRLNYGARVLANKKAKISTERGIHFEVENLGRFFEVVSASILSEATGTMLELLSGGDIRKGLALVREFLGSGHISADRALYDTAGDIRTHFPPHEFFKGAIFGQRKHYREEESLIINIFDSKLGAPDIQLLRLHMLNKLVSMASERAFEGILVDDLIGQLHQIGIPERTIIGVVEDFLDFRVVRTSDGGPLATSTAIVPSRLGAFVLRELAGEFRYIEPCLLDICIYDEGEWQELGEITQQIESSRRQKRLELRVERARRFLHYLDLADERWVVRCKRYNLGEFWDQQIIAPHIRVRAERDFDKVLHSAERMFARRGESEG